MSPIDIENISPDEWHRLQSVLDEVIDLPEHQRLQAVNRLCGGDASLRSQVEALLAADRRSAHFLTTPVLEMAGALLAGDSGFMAPEPALEGKRIGPYRILREIGRGGMGRVYLAERVDGQFEQTVAIKILKRGLDTDELIRRFLRERQILARLGHPNIARLLDGGATEDGRPYLAMEFIEGKMITLWCDERASSLEARLDLFQAVCAAVLHAHRHLVIHRDLKPANVLVTLAGEPKLLDFGIARLLADDQGSPGDTLTRQERSPMTPAYAAPEQLRGEPATTATDVYGLGMILYELLVGRKPFKPRGRSSEAFRHEILEEMPLEPSRVLTREDVARRRSTTLDRLRRVLRGDLDAIALGALAIDPAHRYGSVEALLGDLRRYRTHLPVQVRRPGRAYRLRKAVRRHAGALAAVATVLILLVSYAATTAVMLQRQRRERARAETAARRAERIQAFLADMLSSAGPARLGAGTEHVGSANPEVRVRDVLDQAAARAERELADDPPVLAGVEQAIGDTYFSLGLYGPSERHARAALATRQRLGDRKGMEETLALLSQILERETRYDEALTLAHQGASLTLQDHGERSPQYALALRNEEEILADMGRTREAGFLIERALRIGRAELLPNDPRLIEILGSAAVNRARQGDFTSADSLYRDVLARAMAAYGKEHPYTLTAMSNVATNLGELKRYAAAESLNREVLAMRRRVLGNEHPLIATTLSNLGLSLREQGKFAEGESALREALAMRIRLLGPENRETLATRSILANLLLRTGRSKEAEAIHRSVLSIRRRILGPDHPLVATSLLSLADALQAQGRNAEARPLLEEAITLREHGLPAGHPDIQKARDRLAALDKDLASGHRRP